MGTKSVTKKAISKTVLHQLNERPGQSVSELALSLKVNRHFMSGFLQALEEAGTVSSRAVGTARIYFRVSGG